MTAVVRQLRRTTTVDAQPTGAEPEDYCQCGRGPVIGVFGLRVGGSNDRLAFFPLGSVYASLPEVAADVCCLDCVTDAVADLASGKTNAELQEIARQRRERQQALGIPRLEDRQPTTDLPRLRAQGQTPPIEGDQVT